MSTRTLSALLSSPARHAERPDADKLPAGTPSSVHPFPIQTAEQMAAMTHGRAGAFLTLADERRKVLRYHLRRATGPAQRQALATELDALEAQVALLTAHREALELDAALATAYRA